MKYLTAYISILAVLSGCTHREVYEAVQANRLGECEKRVGSQREECIESHAMPYEEYERVRAARQD